MGQHMTSIRIRKTVESATLHLPELESLVGHTVDITIEDHTDAGTLPPGVTPGTGDWNAVLAASQGLEDYDYDALRDQDACDIQDAQDRLK
jgi:hypothetical protein